MIELVFLLFCVISLFVLLDIAMGEDDTSIPRDVVRRKGDR